MLKRSTGAGFCADITCRGEAHNVRRSDFNYYDKDGFELTVAERKLYQDNYFALSDCLNHWAFQNPWLELLPIIKNGLHLDHCMLLHRCDFAEDALAQIKCYNHPGAAFMAQTKPKWGFDFAMDHLDDTGDAVEVLHIELDDYDLNRINDKRLQTESWLTQQDWQDLAQQIRKHQGEWQHLQGFAQNDWKARYLMGWTRAEYTKKSFNFAK